MNTFNFQNSLPMILYEKQVEMMKIKGDFLDSFLQWYEKLLKMSNEAIKTYEKAVCINNKCGKGCCDCCYQMIEVYPYELFTICQYIKKKNLVKLIKKRISINKSRKNEEDINYDLLSEENRYYIKNQYYRQKKKCIFLDNSKCLIYPVRPISCLNYFSNQVCNQTSKRWSCNSNYSYYEVEDWITNQVINFINENYNNIPNGFNSTEMEILHLGIEKLIENAYHF